MMAGAFASASSTVCPSAPGAPSLRTTFNSALARLASVAASSSSRLVSAALALGPLVLLRLAFCSRKLRRSDASERSCFPPPEGLSANTKLNCRGPFFLNPSPPLLRWLSPASSLLWGDPTSAWASSRRRCLLRVYRSRGPTQTSLGKFTGCPAAPAPNTAPASNGFWASRFQTRLPGRSGLHRGLPFVRCCGSPRTSSPHGLTAPAPASHDGEDCVQLPPARGCYHLAPRRTFTCNPVPMPGTHASPLAPLLRTRSRPQGRHSRPLRSAGNRPAYLFSFDWPMISAALKLMLQVGKELPTKKLSERSG